MQVVWITGYNHTGHLYEIGTQLGVYRCLDKPFKIGDIRETALKALAAHESINCWQLRSGTSPYLVSNRNP